MKEKRKPKGTKAEIHAYKKRSTLIGTAIIAAILVVIIVLSSLLIYSYLNPSQPNEPPTLSPELELRAAIVDHLSLTIPNESFNQTVTNILEEAGYTVDYYAGEEVTVDFYRNLPTHGYSIIVLRSHSGLREGEKAPLCLFTSERYSETKYSWEQLTDRLTGVAYSEEEAKKGIAYFAITPKFVQQDMKGNFQNATIVMMGCNGLTYPYMAQAFVGKGAKVYISWDLAVSAGHTDKAIMQLLEYLITEKQTLEQAVTETMKEVGPEPENGSILLYYPETLVDSYVIPNIKNNLIASDVVISS